MPTTMSSTAACVEPPHSLPIAWHEFIVVAVNTKGYPMRAWELYRKLETELGSIDALVAANDEALAAAERTLADLDRQFLDIGIAVADIAIPMSAATFEPKARLMSSLLEKKVGLANRAHRIRDAVARSEAALEELTVSKESADEAAWTNLNDDDVYQKAIKRVDDLRVHLSMNARSKLSAEATVVEQGALLRRRKIIYAIHNSNLDATDHTTIRWRDRLKARLATAIRSTSTFRAAVAPLDGARESLRTFENLDNEIRGQLQSLQKVVVERRIEAEAEAVEIGSRLKTAADEHAANQRLLDEVAREQDNNEREIEALNDWSHPVARSCLASLLTEIENPNNRAIAAIRQKAKASGLLDSAKALTAEIADAEGTLAEITDQAKASGKAKASIETAMQTMRRRGLDQSSKRLRNASSLENIGNSSPDSLLSLAATVAVAVSVASAVESAVDSSNTYGGLGMSGGFQ